MELINQQSQLQEICDLIADGKIAAIDTEFIRETTYLPILCLIQINIEGKCYLVDTLCGLDLSFFFAILNDKNIIKIFHSSRQDLEVFYQNFSSQISPKSIIDTQIMSALCGFGLSVSYSSLVKTFFNVEVAKDLQRSNWQARPLSLEQMEYAVIDVEYLKQIYEILSLKLKSEGKFEWAMEEMDLNIIKVLENDDLNKKFSFLNQSKEYIQNIKLLTKWRDDKARLVNVPRGFVIKDEVLDRIAYCNPQTFEKLEKCGFKTRILDQNIKSEILDLMVNKPLEVDFNIDDYQRITTRTTDEQKTLLKQAKILLQEKAAQYQISPELIINQNNLSHLVFGYKKVSDILLSWRYKVFGADLNNLIKNNL